MYNFSKPYLSINQLIQKLKSQGMNIPVDSDAEEALKTIGYYRLKGYCYHLVDPNTKKYISNININNIIELYRFDTKLSRLIFEYNAQIEVCLRARLVEAAQPKQDALILNDPSFFKNKNIYWKNHSSISNEIERANDTFIKHYFDNYDGNVPLWAAVETFSFGTLSKLISNLKSGKNSIISNIIQNYKIKNDKGKLILPSIEMFTSWIYAVSIIRNICAHNGRIYSRTFKVSPQIIRVDVISPSPRYTGLYQILLAMKYLRPTDKSWNDFVTQLKSLFNEYNGIYDITRMGFPSDWSSHFNV